MPLALRARSYAAAIAALAAAVIAFPRPAAAVPARIAGHVHAQAGHRARAPSLPRPLGVVVHVVQTTATLSQRMKRLPDMWMEPGRKRTPMVVQVQDGVRYQTILGFGAALTDTSAWLIHDVLAPSARNELMRALFSSDGIDLNYVRLPMGASDFTAGRKPYSYDDVPRGKSDPGLRHFSVRHDVPYIIPTLRQARAIDPGVFIIANPWSAPGWMKANQRLDNFRSAGSLLPVDYGPLAAYFVRFLQAYRSRGVPVDAVAPQNEPGVPSDPGMELSEPNEATFIARYLRPFFTAAGLSTQVYGLDMGWDMFPYADALAAGPAGGYLNGISWHCYFGSPAAMTQLHALAPRMIQLVNECSPEARPFSTAELLIGSLRNRASAVALWNLALDPAGGPVQAPNRGCPGCRGLVIVDRTTHSVHLGVRYYQLGQVSEFVAHGAARIGANTLVSDAMDAGNVYQPTVGLDDVAFVNPGGEKVLVTYNSSPRPVRFALSWHGHSLLYRQPAGAMTTFTWR